MGCGPSKVLAETGVVPSNGLTSATDFEGIEASPTQRKRVLAKFNSQVENQLEEAHSRVAQRALFLGTGESGKSTVFKQLRLNYGQSFSHFERQQYSKLIWMEVLRAMRVIVDRCEEARDIDWMTSAIAGGGKFKKLLQSLDLSRHALLAAESAEARGFLSAYALTAIIPPTEARLQPREPLIESAYGTMIDAEARMKPLIANTVAENVTRADIAEAIHGLWQACPQHIRAQVEASQFGLDTNTAYFASNVKNFSDQGYLATDDDILRARIKTTGIVTAEFFVKGNELQVMDVGGQRVERRKWLYGFDDVSSILFVVAVSEYDQTLVEDERVNRLDEALEVFEQTVNSQWFRAKSVFLFLNKVDILKHKVHISNFKDYFSGFSGNETDFQQVLEYIESLFRARIKSNCRNLYTHHTCATDRSSMKFIIDAVTDSILYENLKWAGMI